MESLQNSPACSRSLFSREEEAKAPSQRAESWLKWQFSEWWRLRCRLAGEVCLEAGQGHGRVRDPQVGLRQVMGEPDRGAAPVCLVRGLFLFFVFGDRFLTL